MKSKLLILWLWAGLLVTGCFKGSPPAPALTDPVGRTQVTDTSPRRTTAGTNAPASSPATKATAGYPTRGILSDAALWGPDNPKTHAAVPVAPGKAAPDKTRPENEAYRPIFADYLTRTYPEQPFRIFTIESYQYEGKTFKRASAQSSVSRDILLTLYYDGQKVFDSFQKDVVKRQNTMNRWRFEFRSFLDPIARGVASSEIVKLDVSYDYYPENIELIRLDQPLEPQSGNYRRCLELYFNMGYTDPEKVAQTAWALYGAVRSAGYAFHEYYIYLESARGEKTAYLVPPALTVDPAFPDQLRAALSGDQPGNLIRPVAHPAP